jgi:FixJ family two-component response regulator
VVTDLRMPGLSGIELCDRLGRLHPELARRLVVITGDTASPAVAEFLAGGGRPFLQKPFDMRDLAELLDRVASAAGPA